MSNSIWGAACEACAAVCRAFKTTDGTHRGPSRAICAVCGKRIESYESRYYGGTGAVHIWDPDPLAPLIKAADCRTDANKHLYPHYYTDG